MYKKWDTRKANAIMKVRCIHYIIFILDIQYFCLPSESSVVMLTSECFIVKLFLLSELFFQKRAMGLIKNDEHSVTKTQVCVNAAITLSTWKDILHINANFILIKLSIYNEHTEDTLCQTWTKVAKLLLMKSMKGCQFSPRAQLSNS